MNNKTIMNSAFVSYEEFWRSQRVLSALADNTLLDLQNSAQDTQPHSLIFCKLTVVSMYSAGQRLYL